MIKIISVIGSTTCSEDVYNYALKLGEALVDHGYTVATGGKSGVMEAALKGARKSKSYTKGRTIAVLPSYNFENANKFADIVIPTGLGYARNIILVSMAHAVVSVSGGAGTLSEIAIASQLKKPIILTTKFTGWSEELSNKDYLDNRKVHLLKAKNIEESIDLINKATVKLKGYKACW